MLPVISYKVGGDAAGAASGRFNAVAEQAATRLASYGLPTAVTFWHEPYGDMTGGAVRRGEQAAAADLQARRAAGRSDPQRLAAGPPAGPTFASYCPDELFEIWDWFGIDTYESGTMAAPGPSKPAAPDPGRWRTFLTSRGHDLPLGVGEYNGYSAETIAAAGEALLSTPNVWFGCLWNSSGGKGVALTGDRLAAFQRTLADARSAEPRTV